MRALIFKVVAGNDVANEVIRVLDWRNAPDESQSNDQLRGCDGSIVQADIFYAGRGKFPFPQTRPSALGQLEEGRYPLHQFI